jgi:hypothetical protein
VHIDNTMQIRCSLRRVYGTLCMLARAHVNTIALLSCAVLLHFYHVARVRTAAGSEMAEAPS